MACMEQRKMHTTRLTSKMTTLVASTVLAACLSVPTVAASAAELETPEPTRWAPAGIASALFESHAAFDPVTGDLLFVRSAKDFTGWHLLMSHCGASGWTSPQP